MCLAIPAKVTALEAGDMAVVAFEGVKKRISVALVEDIAVGDYVLVHVGYALHRVSEEEALAMANSTLYGLASVLWTQDVKRAHRLARQLQAGIVWVNCWMVRDLRTPFGGMKSSGVGREGGFEALRFFTEAKNVCVRL